MLLLTRALTPRSGPVGFARRRVTQQSKWAQIFTVAEMMNYRYVGHHTRWDGSVAAMERDALEFLRRLINNHEPSHKLMAAGYSVGRVAARVHIVNSNTNTSDPPPSRMLTRKYFQKSRSVCFNGLLLWP